MVCSLNISEQFGILMGKNKINSIFILLDSVLWLKIITIIYFN